MRKRAISLILGLTMLFGFTLGVGAAPVWEKITAHLNWSVKFNVDGKSWVPKDDKGNKLAAITYNNTTYLPVRAVSEAVGTAVNWDAKSQTVQLGERTSAFQIGKEEIYKGAFAFPTVDKQYTVQNGKDYGSGIVLQDINSASKSFKLLPGGQYQKLNLTLFSLEGKYDINVKVSHGDIVLKEVIIPPGQSVDVEELNIGGMKEIQFTAKSNVSADAKIFVTGHYK